jgi:hypothetical protein
MQETANGLRALGQRLVDPASRAARGRLKGASVLPMAGAAMRSRARVSATFADARARGQRTLDAGRAEAEALLRRSLVGAVDWTGRKVMPRLVQSLGPGLAEEVVPRLTAGAEAALDAHRTGTRPSTVSHG